MVAPGIVVILGLAVVLGVAGLVGTWWWAIKLWKRRAELSWWVKLAVGCMVTSTVAGVLGMLGLVKSFGAVGGQTADPSQKARVLGEGISEVMNCTASALVLWVPSAIVLALLTRKSATRRVR